jgi:hypothetical protein
VTSETQIKHEHGHDAFHAACEVADEVLMHVVAAYNAKMAAIEVWGQLHCEPANQDNAHDAECATT